MFDEEINYVAKAIFDSNTNPEKGVWAQLPEDQLASYRGLAETAIQAYTDYLKMNAH